MPPGSDTFDPQELNAASFPHEVREIGVRQTPLSWIVLTGPYAYKIKKPVRLDFLDASSLERRRALCSEELRLNRRYAPELYRDVVPIVRTTGGLRVGADGVPLEFAVRMRQFEPDQELAWRLAHTTVRAEGLVELGSQLADWHAAAPRAEVADAYGSAPLLSEQVLATLPALYETLADDAALLERLRNLEGRLRAWLEALGPQIQQRRETGFVREGHGDLHAGNVVCWQRRWLPFDCLEFEPSLRWIDTLNDAAFLYMDLIGRQQPALAHDFLSAYLERGGDYAGLSLLPLFACYRALVRAKVDALALSAGTPSPAGAGHDVWGRRLRGRLELARQLAEPRSAALLLMHGVSGSGKSWFSQRLIGPLQALRIRSDLERRRLFGAGAYSAEQTAQTYERLYTCAAQALSAGYRCIVDAAFLERAQRERFRALASARGCPLLILSCRAPTATLAARVAARGQQGGDPSEATVAVLGEQLRGATPLSATERAITIEIETHDAAALPALIDRLRAGLERR